MTRSIQNKLSTIVGTKHLIACKSFKTSCFSEIRCFGNNDLSLQNSLLTSATAAAASLGSSRAFSVFDLDLYTTRMTMRAKKPPRVAAILTPVIASQVRQKLFLMISLGLRVGEGGRKVVEADSGVEVDSFGRTAITVYQDLDRKRRWQMSIC